MASNYLGEDLYNIAYVDSDARPDLHTVCLITHCYGIYSLVAQQVGKPLAAIGFSQGEFTAVAAAGGIGFPQVLELVYRLELLILNNQKIRDGAMVRIVELERAKLSECCSSVDPEGKKVSLAIHLSSDQNIISGDREMVGRVSEMARKRGARWAIALNSGGSFHSPICSSILAESGPIFDEYDFSDSAYDVYSCVDGLCSRNARDVKRRLSHQVAMPILWDKIITGLYNRGVEKLIELGPGCTVSGNSRIICPDIAYKWVNHAPEITELVGSRTL